MSLLLLISLLHLVYSVYSANHRIDPLVKINQGLVRGIKSVEDGYYSFLGIPYAQVDLKNPFGQSLPHPGFEEVIFNAYDGTKRCPQAFVNPYIPRAGRNDDETIDCLTLNIFVPNAASSQNPLPVMVWIHGGVFGYGSAGDYGVKSLVKKGIIVVSINYRLGAYGFMCLGIPSVPGNQGLKDQLAALRWIRQNINSFGGNPYNVTIAGQSAGSSSVLLHLYSDKEKIFNKVIAQSGVPQVDGMFVDGDENAALKIAHHLGFNTTNTEEALIFLSINSHKLISAATVDLQLELRPCKEKSFSGVENFVENYPYSLSNPKKIRNTPIMIGQTTTEQAGFLGSYGKDYFNRDPFREKLTRNFNLDEATLDSAAKMIKHFYIGDEIISSSLTSELEMFDSDFLFSHPIQRTITNLLNEDANPVYAYEFSYVGDSMTSTAAHSSELQYLFETSSLERNLDDQLISDRITTMWTNFVKFGNPTPTTSELVPVAWTPVSGDNKPYLVIDTDIRMENRINKERMAFWDLFYTVYGKYTKLARSCNI